MIKIYDVAKKAGVSLATVSRVINNPEKVKEKTRVKVQAVIQELGYKPNAIAQGLASRKSTTIAIVVPDILRASISEVLDGVTKIAAEYNYKALLFVLSSTNKTITETLSYIFSTQVDGIIYINDRIEATEADMLESCGIPVVLTNSIISGRKLPSSTIDYFQAAVDSVKKLVDEDRKEILLLSGESQHEIDVFKEKGYTYAMQQAGLKPKIVRLNDNNTQVAYDEALDFIKSNKFDGVIGVNDSSTIVFMNALLENTKLDVPSDVSFIGFQNTRLAQLSSPRLSCVDPKIYRIGESAMRLLTQLMKNEEVEAHAAITKHNFVKRGTTLK